MSRRTRTVEAYVESAEDLAPRGSLPPCPTCAVSQGSWGSYGLLTFGLLSFARGLKPRKGRKLNIRVRAPWVVEGGVPLRQHGRTWISGGQRVRSNVSSRRTWISCPTCKARRERHPRSYRTQEIEHIPMIRARDMVAEHAERARIHRDHQSKDRR